MLKKQATFTRCGTGQDLAQGRVANKAEKDEKQIKRYEKLNCLDPAEREGRGS